MNIVRATDSLQRPPQSIEAEESVIGGVLVHGRRYADVRFLVADDFYHPALRTLFEAMGELEAQSKPIDALTVVEQLRLSGTFDKLRAFNGADYLTELMSKVVTVENIGYHARLIAEKATARRLVEACRAVVARGYSDYGDIEDLVAYAQRNVEEARGRATPAAEGFPLVAVGAIPDLGPVRWLVRDLWLAEGVGIIGGEPKSFKSFLATQLATCVAAGRPVFGRHEVQQGTVLMFNAEDHPSMTRDRIARMCRALDVDLKSLPLHLIDVPALRLDDAAQVAKLSRTVAALKPSLLILDPMRDLHGLDENDAQIVSALLAPLRILQREHHCAVALVHHMAKVTETDRRPGQRLRGSSALHGWIDSALYLTHKDNAIITTPEHRSAPSIEPFAFTVENAHTNGGDALWLEADSKPDAAEQEEQRQRVAVLENQIIAQLQEATDPLTAKDLRQRCKTRHEALMEAMTRLIAARQVVEEVVTRGRNPVPGYRLNT